MTDFANDGGVWKPAIGRWRNDNGVWKPAVQLYTNDNGVWKPVLDEPGGAPIDGVDLASSTTKAFVGPLQPQSVSANPQQTTFSVRFERTANNPSSFKFITLDGLGGIFHNAAGQVSVSVFNSTASVEGRLTTTAAIFPNPSTPKHVLAVYDSTEAVAADRLRLWVGGVEITAFDEDTRANITLNMETAMFGSTLFQTQHVAGALDAGDCDGIVGDLIAIDGLAVTDPTQFDGLYQGSVGPRGYYLQFDNANDLGNDASINANDFTLSNVGPADHVDGWTSI